MPTPHATKNNVIGIAKNLCCKTQHHSVKFQELLKADVATTISHYKLKGQRLAMK